MNASRVFVLHVHDADRGVGTASVDCPRRRVRMPVLVCQACEHCAHVSRTTDPDAWAVVCSPP